MNLRVTLEIGNGDQATYERQDVTLAEARLGLAACGFTAAEVASGLATLQPEWELAAWATPQT